MEMKRIVIALGILITTTAIGSASAAEMPKELRDTWWCADRPGWSPRTHSPWPAGNYRRCHKVTDADDAFEIDASGWGHDMTDDTCKVLRVTSYGKSHFVVRARCNNDEEMNVRVLLRWRLFNGGHRLEIRDANNEMQAPFVGEWCRVSGSLDVPDDQLEFKRQRRGQACASDRRLVITPREMRGIFSSSVAGQETKSIKAEPLSCNLTYATEKKNGWLWSWFICNGKPDMRNVLLLENGKLYLSNTMLEDKHNRERP